MSERGHSLIAKKRGLPMEKNATEQMERNPWRISKYRSDREIIGHDRDRLVFPPHQQPGKREDRCARIEKDYSSGRNVSIGRTCYAGFRRTCVLGSLAQRSEGAVVVSQCAAIRASNVPIRLDRYEIATSSGLRNFELPTNIGQWQKTIPPDQCAQSLATLVDDFDGNTHVPTKFLFAI